MRRGIEREYDVAARVVGFHCLGQKAIKRKRLVIATRHQAFDDIAADGLNGETFDNERIEAVERPQHPLHKPTALWRVRVGVGGGNEIVRP